MDFIQYRLPGKPIVKKQGKFSQLRSLESAKGFVLSSFDKKEKFVFEEILGKEEFSYSSNLPNCATKLEYIEKASEFLKELQEKNLGKAVFSRVKETEYSQEVPEVFNELCLRYPSAFVYVVSSQLFGTWIGATPELLLSGKDGIAKTMALAGTLKNDELSDWTSKEIEEQAYVRDFIQEKLEDFGVENLKDMGTNEVVAGPVRHLGTEFNFSVETNQVLNLAGSLHPTPAVSGYPQEESIELIRKYESHNRSLYSGIIGFVDDEETQLFVNLRCAQLIEGKAYLYLGGGYTQDSDVEKEWIETENKARTLLNVLENL